MLSLGSTFVVLPETGFEAPETTGFEVADVFELPETGFDPERPDDLPDLCDEVFPVDTVEVVGADELPEAIGSTWDDDMDGFDETDLVFETDELAEADGFAVPDRLAVPEELAATDGFGVTEE